jgi:predicted AAA+ superfamily ATPase
VDEDEMTRAVADREVLRQPCDFIGGPRQVGKTTLALAMVGQGADENHPAYLNWDNPQHASRLRRHELAPDQPLLVLDEIHKYGPLAQSRERDFRY